MQSVEQVYAAAFQMLQQLAVSAGGPFKTISRRLRLVEDVDSTAMPALYQHQLTVAPRTVLLGGLAMMAYRAHWYIYASAPNMDEPTTPILNPLVDSLLSVFPQEGGNVSAQVNGITVSLQLDGTIEFFEGLLDVKSVARIPMLILVS